VRPSTHQLINDPTGEDLLELLNREMQERQNAQRSAEEARQEAGAAEKLRELQVKQISALNATVSDLHSQLQRHLAESGDAVRVRAIGLWLAGARVSVCQRGLMQPWVAHTLTPLL
jgi:hypothetical protein